jgi:mannose-6-phosphate isomerase-like protein (cupin superfamily)
MTGYVVHEDELEIDRGNGDTAARAVAIDSSAGSSVLELHLARYGHGRSSPRMLEGVQEIMYTTSGSGSLTVAGEAHDLEAGTAVYLTAGETYEIDNPGSEDLVIVSPTSPRSPRAATGSSATWSRKRSAAATRRSSSASSRRAAHPTTATCTTR